MSGPDPAPMGGNPSQFDPFAPVDYPADYPDPPAFGPPPGYPGPQPPGYPAPPPGGYPYPGPVYGYDPYVQYPYGVTPGRNGPSVAALVCGLLSLPLSLCFLPSIAGIVLGIIGIRQTQQTGQPGREMAIAGLVFSAATLLLGVVILAGGFAGA